MQLDVKLVGILGHDRAGKSALARNLKARLEAEGKSVEILPFAQGVREGVFDALELKENQRDLVWGKPTPPYMRDMLRGYSRAMIEIYGDDIWVGRWESACQYAFDAGTDVVIVDDFRRPIEFELLSCLLGSTFISLERTVEEPQFDDSLPSIVREVWQPRELVKRWAEQDGSALHLKDAGDEWQTLEATWAFLGLGQEVAA